MPVISSKSESVSFSYPLFVSLAALSSTLENDWGTLKLLLESLLLLYHTMPMYSHHLLCQGFLLKSF